MFIVPKKRLQGTVVSNKADKTLTVRVETIKENPKYKKKYKTYKKYYAHDEKNEMQEGDVVVIEMCRPISKNKKWRVIRKVSVL